MAGLRGSKAGPQGRAATPRAISALNAFTAAAGADFIAVSAGVWSHGDGAAAAVKAFNTEIARGVAARD